MIDVWKVMLDIANGCCAFASTSGAWWYGVIGVAILAVIMISVFGWLFAPYLIQGAISNVCAAMKNRREGAE